MLLAATHSGAPRISSREASAWMAAVTRKAMLTSIEKIASEYVCAMQYPRASSHRGFQMVNTQDRTTAQGTVTNWDLAKHCSTRSRRFRAAKRPAAMCTMERTESICRKRRPWRNTAQSFGLPPTARPDPSDPVCWNHHTAKRKSEVARTTSWRMKSGVLLMPPRRQVRHEQRRAMQPLPSKERKVEYHSSQSHVCECPIRAPGV
mmetsp:Transcript_111009/g.294989  ORF Transcript_111009/g.294989 Transcript_111009/m.294989 type:complete len:205 (+) Transcript_111009:1180-1794(+)